MMPKTLAEMVQQYKPSSSTTQLITQTPILLLVGPTGAGKDALKDKLLTTGEYHHIISHTTRPPRINHGILEQDGLEYHFIDPAKAEQMLEAQAFVEAKFYSGNLYGTSVSEIQMAHDEHKIAMTDVEVQGVAEYKAFDQNVMAAFLLPPDFETWQGRLQRRYGDVVDAVDAKRRMETALYELNQLLTSDYYTAFVNDDLEQTFKAVQTYAQTQKFDVDQEQAARRDAEALRHEIKQYLTEI